MARTPRCTACNRSIEGPRATVRFDGFTTERLNGVTFYLHSTCLRLEFPDSEPLPPRLSDPVAEALADALVEVEWEPQGYTATCRECGEVALKDVRDDADLSAAYHLARVHSGIAS